MYGVFHPFQHMYMYMYFCNDLQNDALKDAEYSYATEVPGSSELQTIEVYIECRGKK